MCAGLCRRLVPVTVSLRCDVHYFAVHQHRGDRVCKSRDLAQVMRNEEK
jgi:hypothetical protein